ncbi:MAG: hypothetical protein M3Y59_10505 [Myxococcota bacterium]|nr:hypothetical protein [Myxococcota bacterium]
MIEVVEVDLEHGVTELHIDDGCPLCSGPLQIRRSPGAVSSYCGHCVWISRPMLSVGIGGVQVTHKAMAA